MCNCFAAMEFCEVKSVFSSYGELLVILKLSLCIKLLKHIIISLVVPVGNMKRILCSDWPLSCAIFCLFVSLQESGISSG